MKNGELSSDIGSEIIMKLKKIISKLNKLLEEDGEELKSPHMDKYQIQE